eukprot:TRINITY_DN102747_c0_g1_i1.p1 TRINITY_DN102747_c0_g1~~TRINITY_DN102747_c0_g1_i1.p1  ORF type:complete len:718 (+),score=72.44 TRINITY_DN102747_c0_g1_i1:35-2155(+)
MAGDAPLCQPARQAGTPTEVVVGLCLSWFAFWLTLHLLGRYFFRGPAEALCYHLRLRRSSLYCILAVSGGSFLLAKDLVLWADAGVFLPLSFYHQISFSMAVGHWMNTMWEDVATFKYLHQGKKEMGCLIMYGYFWHHAVTIFIYVYILCTGTLSGLLGSLGLIFEAPVVLMNERELAFSTVPKPRWLSSLLSVDRHWAWTYAAFIMFRGFATVLYLATLIPGTSFHECSQNAFASDADEVVFHVAGVFFSFLNPIIFAMLVMWHQVDRQHLADPPSSCTATHFIGGSDDGSLCSVAALGLASSLGCALGFGRLPADSAGWEAAMPSKLDWRLDWVTPVLCCCWTVFWYSGHYLFECFPIEQMAPWLPWQHSAKVGAVASMQEAVIDSSEYEVRCEIANTSEAASLNGYRSRVRRHVAYYSVATIAGAVLLCKWNNWPRDLLLGFSAAHRLLFTMSVGNWVVSLWEDWQSYAFLGQGMPELNMLMFAGYACHHCIALFAFGFCLCTRKLGGLCAIGLFFEASWILVTWRELGVAKARTRGWSQRKWWLHTHYSLTFILFACSRWGATVLYIFAIVNETWASHINRLDHDSLMTFHVLGIFFTVLNLWLMGLLMMWYAVDLDCSGNLPVQSSCSGQAQAIEAVDAQVVAAITDSACEQQHALQNEGSDIRLKTTGVVAAKQEGGNAPAVPIPDERNRLDCSVQNDST